MNENLSPADALAQAAMDLGLVAELVGNGIEDARRGWFLRLLAELREQGHMKQCSAK